MYLFPERAQIDFKIKVKAAAVNVKKENRVDYSFLFPLFPGYRVDPEILESGRKAVMAL